MKKIFILPLLCVFFLSSCFVNRNTVGFGPVGDQFHVSTLSKAHQHYLLLGLIRLKEPHPTLPPVNIGYQIKTSFSLRDILLTVVTVGIYSGRTVKIIVNKDDEKAINEQQPKK